MRELAGACKQLDNRDIIQITPRRILRPILISSNLILHLYKYTGPPGTDWQTDTNKYEPIKKKYSVLRGT